MDGDDGVPLDEDGDGIDGGAGILVGDGTEVGMDGTGSDELDLQPDST